MLSDEQIREIREVCGAPVVDRLVLELCDTIDALRAEVVKLQNDLLAESMKTDEMREIEIANSASTVTAEKLQKIAKTGKHSGVFGGAEIEAAAQTILTLRAKLNAQADAYVKLQKHRDRWRAFAKGHGPQPSDYLPDIPASPKWIEEG